jgi:hypothetical protein
MNPTEPEHDDTRRLTPEELAEEIEKTRAEIERAERLRRLEKIEDADGAWSVDVLLVRGDESEPWRAKHATTWGARDVDKETLSDRLAAAISEAERRANAACPPVPAQGVLFEEEDEMSERTSAIAEDTRHSEDFVKGIGHQIVELGSAYDSSKKTRIATRKGSKNPPEVLASADGKKMRWSNAERDQIGPAVTIETHEIGATHLEVVRIGLLGEKPIQQRIAPDMLVAWVMAASASSEAAALRDDGKPLYGFGIDNDLDLRRHLGLTRKGVATTREVFADFAELLTTVLVVKNPKHDAAPVSVPFFLATQWPTVRGNPLPMSTMLARLARAQDTRRIEASEVAQLNGEGAEEERADLPATVVAERDYAAKEGDESSSLLHGCQFIVNPDLLGNVKTALLYHCEGAKKLMRGERYTFARELYRIVFLLLRKTTDMLKKRYIKEAATSTLGPMSDLRRVSNAELLLGTGWRPEHPDQIRLPWRALLRFALVGEAMKAFYQKYGSRRFVEKAREEMRRLGKIGVFPSWTEEKGAKDDPLGGVAVITIPRSWVDWRRVIQDDHEAYEAKKALEKGRTTPKAVEP